MTSIKGTQEFDIPTLFKYTSQVKGTKETICFEPIFCCRMFDTIFNCLVILNHILRLQMIIFLFSLIQSSKSFFLSFNLVVHFVAKVSSIRLILVKSNWDSLNIRVTPPTQPPKHTHPPTHPTRQVYLSHFQTTQEPEIS